MVERSRITSWRAAFFDCLAHYGGQAFYVLMEGFGRLFGRAHLVAEQQAVRQAAHRYWIAKGLRRAGKPREAFAQAREGFSCLEGSDRKATFLQIGVLIAGLLDELGEQLGDSTAAYPELKQVLEVLKELQSTPPRSPQLDEVVSWIEHRLGGAPKTSIAES